MRYESEQSMVQKSPPAEDVTRLPTRPSGESAERCEASAIFMTESSLQVLSLILAETSPALSSVNVESPPSGAEAHEQALRRETPVPPALLIPAMPNPQVTRNDRTTRVNSTIAMQRRRDRRASQAELVLPSWPHAKGQFKFGRPDALRWWLLYPGRIEFLLWLLGSLLLTIVTGALIVAVLWGVGWLHLAVSASLRLA